MKFGIREICDVVLKSKTTQKIGSKTFFKGEPVLYFDTLKTSTMEGAATTVYADGGRGNAHLVAWDGDRTLTFTMEDALISAEGLSILAGADLIEGSDSIKIKQHITERVKCNTAGSLTLEKGTPVTNGGPNNEDYIYVMALNDSGEIVGEPMIGTYSNKTVVVNAMTNNRATNYAKPTEPDYSIVEGNVYLVDYYIEKGSGAKQIDITNEIKSVNFYLEASTVFRAQDGKDYPAEFIIPNCKVQSNFTFTMASTGDPSTFTFTLDTFPDYTKFDPENKVFASIQIIGDEDDTNTGKMRTESPEPEDTNAQG